MSAMNPILGELANLSPGAKAALQAVHQAGTTQAATNPMSEQLGLPSNPTIAALRHPAAPAAPAAAEPAPLTMPSPAMPAAMLTAPPAVKQPTTLESNIAKRDQVQQAKPALESVYGKVADSKFGQAHPLAGKVLGGLAQIPSTLADIALSGAAPGVGRFVPGSTANNQFKLQGLNNAINQEQGEAQKTAQTANLEDQPELRQAKLDLDREKLGETQRQHDQQLREHGFKVDETGQVVPLPYEEMSESQQAVHDLRASQEEVAKATADLKKAQKDGIPAQVQMAQQRIQTAQQNAATAAGRLGLGRDTLAFHEQQDTEKQDEPSTVAKGRADQGRAVIASANDLKDFIDKNPSVFGNIGSYWEKAANNTPISDPAASKAIAKIASFAALQPALHGMRGGQVMREFEQMIGGIPKSPEALKAAIDGITESAATPMIDAGSRHGGKPNGSTEGSHPQRPANVPDGYVFKDGPKGKGWYKP